MSAGITNRSSGSILRGYLDRAHQHLDEVVTDLTDEQIMATPSGGLPPIAAHYVHTVVSEDFLVQMILQGIPLLADTSWRELTGISEFPPKTVHWQDWAHRLRVTVDRVHNYAHAVYQETADYVEGLSDHAINLQAERSAEFGFGDVTREFLIGQLLLHIANHTGEISLLRSLQGLRGYP